MIGDHANGSSTIVVFISQNYDNGTLDSTVANLN